MWLSIFFRGNRWEGILCCGRVDVKHVQAMLAAVRNGLSERELPLADLRKELAEVEARLERYIRCFRAGGNVTGRCGSPTGGIGSYGGLSLYFPRSHPMPGLLQAIPIFAACTSHVAASIMQLDGP